MVMVDKKGGNRKSDVLIFFILCVILFLMAYRMGYNPFMNRQEWWFTDIIAGIPIGILLILHYTIHMRVREMAKALAFIILMFFLIFFLFVF